MTDFGDIVPQDVLDDHEHPCPLPGCDANCRMEQERLRHLQKEHNLSYEAAVEYVERMGGDGEDEDDD